MTTKSSLLKILEKSSRKGLGRGNLGVLVARAGVGKTACLVHIAMDKLLRNERLVHASLQDSPEKVTSYYNVIFSELVQALDLTNPSDIKAQIDKNRMILAYLNQSFDLRRLKENLKNLSEKVGFSRHWLKSSRWRCGSRLFPRGVLTTLRPWVSPRQLTGFTPSSASSLSFNPLNRLWN